METPTSALIRLAREWLSVLALAVTIGMYIQTIQDMQRRIDIFEVYVADQREVRINQREEIVQMKSDMRHMRERLNQVRIWNKPEFNR